MCPTTSSGVPRNIRLAAIKNHHLTLRADEDIHLLHTEMQTTFRFFLSDWENLSSVVAEFKSKPSSKYTNEAINQVQLACPKCESLLLQMRSAFDIYVDIPELPVDSFITHTVPSMPLQDFPVLPHTGFSIEGTCNDT